MENVVFEQFRVQRKYARPLARQGFENLVRQECTQYVPGRCRNLKVNVQLEGLTSEAVLLPVWIMAYRYQDHVYRFLLNGQTGKATGQAPTSWKKVLTVVGVVILCIVLGALAIALCSGAMAAAQSSQPTWEIVRVSAESPFTRFPGRAWEPGETRRMGKRAIILRGQRESGRFASG